jgi:ketosteroid isomerase-like protein
VDNSNNDNDSTSSNNNALIQNLVDIFRDAFNNHDPKMLSSLLTEDGEWTDVIGYTMIGRNELKTSTCILLLQY